MSTEILYSGDESPDKLLYLILDYLRSLPPEKRTVVVAGIYCLDTKHLFVATSRQFRNNETGKLTWNHAEKEVLDTLLAKSKNDNIILRNPQNYRFVSSLSSCARPSTTRAHTSCTLLLNRVGFRSEHVGKIDDNARKSGLYNILDFTTTLTANPSLLTVCDNLYQYFIPFKKRGWTKERIIETALEQLP